MKTKTVEREGYTLLKDVPDEDEGQNEGEGIDLDFTPPKSATSPFQPAKTQDRRLKLFLWGDSGVGKTTLALQFPSPAVIDLEGGTELYGEAFSFEVLPASSADEVTAAVEWLLGHRHPYRTLIIDPITIYWDALQRKWSDIFLKRNKKSAGFKGEFYDLQPRDWMTIKAEFKEFVRKLIALDMNIIVTARAKTQYADSGFMKAIGETFDGEKSLPYLFDTILRLYREEGKFMGECLKDRNHKLPTGEFEVSINTFEKVFGKRTLNKKAKPTAKATTAQKKEIREFCRALGLTRAVVYKRLAAYGATSLDDLSRENAEIILGKLQATIDTKMNDVVEGDGFDDKHSVS